MHGGGTASSMRAGWAVIYKARKGVVRWGMDKERKSSVDREAMQGDL